MAALHYLGVKHDKLLDLVEEMSNGDNFATVNKLLQLCGVSRIGHVLSAVSPACVVDIARGRDEALESNLATIQQENPPYQSTHTLPMDAGGAGLTSLERNASGSYLRAFFRIVGPLQQRLTAMGKSTNKAIVTAL